MSAVPTLVEKANPRSLPQPLVAICAGLAVIGVGLAVGLAGSLVVGRALSSLLYGIEPTDPATLASVAALLGGIAIVACYIPARRATRVDPVSSLRAE